MRILFMAVLLIASFSSSGAELNASDLELTGIYSLRLRNRSEVLRLDLEQFALIQILLRRNEPYSSVQIRQRLRSQFITEVNIPELSRKINLASQKVFGHELIKVSNDSFQLSVKREPPPDYSGITFAFDPNVKGVIYRGRFVDLSPMETKVVQMAYEATHQKVPYDSLGYVMEWSNSRRRAQAYLQSINRKTLEATGASILRIARGYGLAFSARLIVDLPEPIKISTIHGAVELSPLATQVFNKLHLEKFSLSSELLVDENEYEDVGLTLDDLLLGIGQINQAFKNLFERELVSALTLRFKDRDHKFTFEDGSFDDLGYFSRSHSRLDELTGKSLPLQERCESSLKSAAGSPVIPQWKASGDSF